MKRRLSWDRWIVFGLFLVLLSVSACGEDPQQLFETAQFEEKQNNHAHAQELYERILRSHPASEYAEKAKARLAAIQADQTQ